MYMRAFIYRFVFVGVLGLGIALGSAFRQSSAQPASPQAPAAAQAAVAAAALPVVTLAPIRVTASAARPAPSRNVVGRTATAATPAAVPASAPESRGSSAAAPNFRLDMPYYSFGKVIPRLGKE